MTDMSGVTPPNGHGAAGGQSVPGGTPQLQVLAQYIKDLSFENPQAPLSLQGAKPQLEVGVDVQARQLGVDQYEVILRVRADAGSAQGASQPQKTFVIELVYGGVFMLKGMPADAVQPILLIECPRLLFPFARRLVADITRDGGFPPLMLDPIDFAGLYRSQLAQQQGRGQSDALA